MSKKEKVVSYTSDEIDKMEDLSDWKAAAKVTDEEVEGLVKNDPDDLYLTDEQLEERTWMYNFQDIVEKEKISIRIDKDILDFFRSQGKGYQGKINNVLRVFVQAYNRD